MWLLVIGGIVLVVLIIMAVSQVSANPKKGPAAGVAILQRVDRCPPPGELGALRCTGMQPRSNSWTP
jgi:hypothetical protein